MILYSFLHCYETVISFLFSGWHLCSNCEKNARYMCYTCTFSLCKSCIKGAGFLCIRGNKGFCESCMRTVMLIEKNEQGNQDVSALQDNSSSHPSLLNAFIMNQMMLNFNYMIAANNDNCWHIGSSLSLYFLDCTSFFIFLMNHVDYSRTCVYHFFTFIFCVCHMNCNDY